MWGNKISKSLTYAVNTLSDEKIRIIVYLSAKSAPDGFEIVREYPFINAVGIETNASELERLARYPAVRYVTSCARVFAAESVSRGIGPPVYVNTSLTGRGVSLAVIDTGVSPHLDFCTPINRLFRFKDLIGGKDDFYDDNGHGTFVAGVACGNGLTSGGKYAGVARDSKVVAVKAIGSDGEGGAFDVLDGMQWILDTQKETGVKVCCMSFGANPTDANDPLRRGAEILVKNGISVVAASGNEGRGAIKTPATSPDVISVGAVDENGKVADFTSRGFVMGRRKPEIYALGVDVISVSANSTYKKMSGTSVSAPYIAGACCLLTEKYPSASPRRIKEMILSSATPTPDGRLVLDLSR